MDCTICVAKTKAQISCAAHLFSICVFIKFIGRDLVFCLTSQSTIFQSCWDGATASWVFTSTLGSLKCLAQGDYMAVVGFEPCTSRSRV